MKQYKTNIHKNMNFNVQHVLSFDIIVSFIRIEKSAVLEQSHFTELRCENFCEIRLHVDNWDN